jgi:hypothetical protein
MERRRKRVEEWRAKKAAEEAAKQQAEEQAASAAQQTKVGDSWVAPAAGGRPGTPCTPARALDWRR